MEEELEDIPTLSEEEEELVPPALDVLPTALESLLNPLLPVVPLDPVRELSLDRAVEVEEEEAEDESFVEPEPEEEEPREMPEVVELDAAAAAEEADAEDEDEEIFRAVFCSAAFSRLLKSLVVDWR